MTDAPKILRRVENLLRDLAPSEQQVVLTTALDRLHARARNRVDDIRASLADVAEPTT